MELPISPQSYRPAPDALVRAVKRSRVLTARMMSEEIALPGAAAFVRPAGRDVRAANFAAEVQAGAEQAAREVLQSIRDCYAEQASVCHAIDTADADLPQALADAAAGEYRPVMRHVLMLHRHQPPPQTDGGIQVIPARAAYGELTSLLQRQAVVEFAGDERFAHQFASAMVDRLDEPRLELFLARFERRPVAVGGVITLGDIGVISPLWADPEYRGRGIAVQLLARVLEHCLRAQFEQVLLERSDGCPSTPFYERAGFSRVVSYRRLVRAAG
jgi:GNAT superfamily N-acetyltransferase